MKEVKDESKMKQSIEKIFLKQKGYLLGLCLLLLSVGFITGTSAWSSIAQRALSENDGDQSQVEQSVYLLKLEKDAEGKETKIPIKGAVFYLFQVTPDGDKQIGGQYTTSDLGKIPVNLIPGDYYFEEVSPSSGYTFDKDEKGEPIKRYPFTITPGMDTTKPIVMAYNQKIVGKLILSKTVANQNQTPLTEEQRQQEFVFKVTFSEEGPFVYRINDGKPQTIKSGETLVLRHGEKAVFEDLPEGLHYSIVEAPQAGYAASASNASGNITKEPVEAAFTNTYYDHLGQLEITKKVVNNDQSPLSDEQKEQEFTFEIEFSDPEASYAYITSSGKKGTLSSGDTFTLKHEETLTFTALPIGETYTVREKETEGYLASPKEYKGQVRTTEKVVLPFINQYQKIPSENDGSLKFSKKVIAEHPDADQEFIFVLTFSDGGTYDYQLNDGQLQTHISGEGLRLKDGDTIAFPHLPAGIHYTLTEKETPGYQAQLNEVSGTVLSGEETNIEFTNIYEEKASLVIEKIGKGEGFDLDKVFTFWVWINGEKLSEPIRLKAGEKSEPIPLKLGDSWRVEEEDVMTDGYAQTSIENGTGVVTEPNQEILATQTNTYLLPPMIDLSGKKTWVIPEGHQVELPKEIIVYLKDGDKIVAVQHVTGPDWTYTFHVPKYDADGKEIRYTVEEEPVPNFKPTYHPESLDITNTYIEPVTLRGLTVEKRLIGDVPEQPETFEFTLMPGSQKVTIQGAGVRSFEPISFNQPGTYTYTIQERNAGSEGYIYDSTVYKWTVVVEEREGKLVVASEEITKDGEQYTEPTLVFVNQYKEPKDKKITIEGQKKWYHGNNPQANQPKSIVVLLLADGKVIKQREVTAADGWRYSFVVDLYDKNGKEIHYTIDESPVPNYEKVIDGYNLINMYKGEPGGGTDKPGPGKPSGQKPPGIFPQSGEKNERIMLVVAGVILIGVVILVYLKTRKKNKRFKK